MKIKFYTLMLKHIANLVIKYLTVDSYNKQMHLLKMLTLSWNEYRLKFILAYTIRIWQI